MRHAMQCTIRNGSLNRRLRRGAVSVWLLVCAPVVLLVFALSIRVTSKRQDQVELQNASDAAALAAAAALVDDSLLREDLKSQIQVLARARGAALRLAELNHVAAKPLMLDPNWVNRSDGQVLLGTLDNPFTRVFDDLLDPTPNLYQPHLNAARIAGRHHGVAASATAFVDRDVLGFRITGSIALSGQFVPSIPVMPLALLSHPVAPSDNCPTSWLKARHDSWESQIMARKGADDWTAVGPSGGVGLGPDGIPEMTVVVSRPGIDALDNGQLVAVGPDAMDGALRQFQTGMTASDLMDRDARLLLDDAANEQEPRNELFLPTLSLQSGNLDSLADALGNIVGERRVWMLYSGTSKPGTDDRLRIVGFVAARVVDVRMRRQTDEKNGELANEPLQDIRRRFDQVIVTLQPSMLITSTAVTLPREIDELSPVRRNWGPRTLFNPYVCKVRLTE
jgi:Flp pilus assembly protein TadG